MVGKYFPSFRGCLFTVVSWLSRNFLALHSSTCLFCFYCLWYLQKIVVQSNVEMLFFSNFVYKSNKKGTIIRIKLYKRVQRLVHWIHETWMKKIWKDTDNGNTSCVHGLEGSILLKSLCYPKQYRDEMQSLSKLQRLSF